MLQLYIDKKNAGQSLGWPDKDAPEVQDQKEWEAQIMGYGLLYDYANPTIEQALAALHGGANPFAVEGPDSDPSGDSRGKPCVHYQDKKALMLVNAVRAAVGEGPGWRQRIKPILTTEGVVALMQRAELDEVVAPVIEEPGNTRAANERDRDDGRL